MLFNNYRQTNSGRQNPEKHIGFFAVRVIKQIMEDAMYKT
jgi:hypothetical protein